MATTLELWFDLRKPSWAPQPVRETYAAALDMCAWADSLGFQAITVGEHHQTEDNYLSSPIQMAGLIGGRTKRLQLRMIILCPFYNPLRLAEDLAVLNLASNGRALPVLSAGYVPAEFDMYGVLRKDRAAAVEEAVIVCRSAWSGQPFSYRGRQIALVSPVPDPVPRLLLGATTPMMIRKAAAIADGLSPAESRLYEQFRAERIKLGKSDPGPFPNQGPSFLHIAEDPERAWKVVGPHWLHTVQSYMHFAQISGRKGYNDKFPPSNSVEDLKASPRFRVVTPEQCLQMIEELGPNSQLGFNPIHGGLHPSVGWESLELFEKKVLPHLTATCHPNILY